MNTPVIEVTRAMILQLGGCRIIVEHTPIPSGSSSFAPRSVPSGQITPAEWRAAEAEVQARTNIPFEPPSVPRRGGCSLMPRVGGKYQALTGVDVEIARVVARDGALWIVVDVNERPVVLKRVDLAWRALPRDRTPPLLGDAILHDSGDSSVAEILGEAEIGGWAVRSDDGVTLHVVRAEARHWVSLGVVNVERR